MYGGANNIFHPYSNIRYPLHLRCIGARATPNFPWMNMVGLFNTDLNTSHVENQLRKPKENQQNIIYFNARKSNHWENVECEREKKRQCLLCGVIGLYGNFNALNI